MKRTVISILIALLLMPVLANANEAVRVPGIYSDLAYNKEGGDLIGMELLIFPSKMSGGDYVVLVQIAEGGAPYAALVPLKVTKDKVEFSMPSDGPYNGLRFTGKFIGADLKVHSSTGTAELLKRGKSYWE